MSLKNNKLSKAIFFDRDGVLIHAPVKNGIPKSSKTLNDIKLSEEIENVCNFYKDHGFVGDGIHTGSIYLESGKQYSFQARMQEVGGGDGLRIVWKSPSRSTWDINNEELGR